MHLKRLVMGVTIAAATAMPVMLTSASAQDSIYIPLFSYRTGPFAGSGIPIASGMHDYLSMLNERDGGIGGVKLNVEECETGYDTKRGVECYESTKAKKPDMSSAGFPELIKDLQQDMGSVGDARDTNRASQMKDHLAMVGEGIGALQWLIMDGKPADFVGEVTGGAQMYGNRVLKAYKET